MLNIKSGGYYYDNESKIQLSLINNPIKSEINSQLSIFEGKDGVLAIEKELLNNFGAYEMTLYSDSGNYLILLEEISIDGDLEVRTFLDKTKPSGFTAIFGEPYATQTITQDFALVRKVVFEFCATGNVNKELLV